MTSTRGYFGLIFGLALAGGLQGQDGQNSASPSAIVLNVTVTDEYARVIKGLKPAQFRVWEDGIPQKIAAFAEGGQQPMQVNADGSTSPLDGPNAAGAPPQGGNPEPGLVLDDVYTISYHPDPSNRNEGFRKIRVEIVQDIYQRLRIRTKAGYRPQPRDR